MSDFRLKVFYSVAKNLSFTKASQELFVSQPAVTKHVHELESMYHVRLFDRMNNKITLTEAGKMEYDMHLLNNEYAGELRLGASTTIAQYILPPILAKFTEKYPQIKVSLIDTNSRNVENAVSEHTIDLGMVEGVFRTPNLKYEAFLCDELVPVVRSSAFPADVEEITLDEFCKIPLVLRERGLSSLNVRMHLGSTESIKSFLACSDCMGIISIAALVKELGEGMFRVIDVSGLQFTRHFCFVSAQGQEIEAAQLFMRFVRSSLGKENK